MIPAHAEMPKKRRSESCATINQDKQPISFVLDLSNDKSKLQESLEQFTMLKYKKKADFLDLNYESHIVLDGPITHISSSKDDGLILISGGDYIHIVESVNGKIRSRLKVTDDVLNSIIFVSSLEVLDMRCFLDQGSSFPTEVGASPASSVGSLEEEDPFAFNIPEFAISNVEQSQIATSAALPSLPQEPSMSDIQCPDPTPPVLGGSTSSDFISTKSSASFHSFSNRTVKFKSVVTGLNTPFQGGENIRYTTINPLHRVCLDVLDIDLIVFGEVDKLRFFSLEKGFENTSLSVNDVIRAFTFVVFQNQLLVINVLRDVIRVNNVFDNNSMLIEFPIIPSLMHHAYSCVYTKQDDVLMVSCANTVHIFHNVLFPYLKLVTTYGSARYNRNWTLDEREDIEKAYRAEKSITHFVRKFPWRVFDIGFVRVGRLPPKEENSFTFYFNDTPQEFDKKLSVVIDYGNIMTFIDPISYAEIFAHTFAKRVTCMKCFKRFILIASGGMLLVVKDFEVVRWFLVLDFFDANCDDALVAGLVANPSATQISAMHIEDNYLWLGTKSGMVVKVFCEFYDDVEL
ncbi:hypothetical protein PCE1_004267 [Barthelona sp. PCE]